MTQDIRLNAEKRKALVQHYENYLRSDVSNKFRKAMIKAKETYDEMKPKVFELAHQVVRSYQPQEDVDTIKAMRAKYGDSGGDIFEDKCFNFINPTMEENDRGEQQENKNEINVDFSLKGADMYSSSHNFAYAYYYDELKSKGYDADFALRWGDERKNPRYYEEEKRIDEYLGFNRSNQNNHSTTNYKNQWENDYSFEVIGRSYCGERQFKVDDTTHSVFKTFKIVCENVSKTHEQFFEYLDKKVKVFEQGIKTYTKYSQAKELFDKLGIALNDSIVDEKSSMALSVYSPTNLADMLTDKDDEFASREEKIAYYKSLMRQSVQ
jgi:hypothetical protein